MPIVKIRLNGPDPMTTMPTFFELGGSRRWEMTPSASGAPWDTLEESLETHLTATFPDLFPA